MGRYSPGQAAAESGFSLETLRYYERIGLLSEVDRDSAGRRSFTDQDLYWLGVLRCLRDTGMPIAQMLRFAELPDDDPAGLAERVAILREHDQAVAAQATLLALQRKRLQLKIAGYQDDLARALGEKPDES